MAVISTLPMCTPAILLGDEPAAACHASQENLSGHTVCAFQCQMRVDCRKIMRAILAVTAHPGVQFMTPEQPASPGIFCLEFLGRHFLRSLDRLSHESHTFNGNVENSLLPAPLALHIYVVRCSVPSMYCLTMQCAQQLQLLSLHHRWWFFFLNSLAVIRTPLC